MIITSLTADSAVGYGLTSARFWATAAALIGVAGVGLAWRSTRLRAENRHRGRRLAVAAVGAGAIAFIGGLINLLVADGGPGTGNGVVGGAAAIATGLLAIALGSRRLSSQEA